MEWMGHAANGFVIVCFEGCHLPRDAGKFLVRGKRQPILTWSFGQSLCGHFALLSFIHLFGRVAN